MVIVKEIIKRKVHYKTFGRDLNFKFYMGTREDKENYKLRL